MDYDDQMVYAKTILERYPHVLAHFQEAFPYICVDESQDTSRIQHAIINLLARKSGNIFWWATRIRVFMASVPLIRMR